MGGVVIGFSGGVDSTLLLKVAFDVLGTRAVGVIAVSPVYPQYEIQNALQFGKKIGVQIRALSINHLADRDFIANPENRCFFCKCLLYQKMQNIADEEELPYIADGTNRDDERDYRPGHKAQTLFTVRTPLREANLSKDEIRMLSQQLGLSTFDKPSYACLASRIPYGSSITQEKLAMIAKAEEFLQECGFKTVRIRYYETLARIEVGRNEFPFIFNDAMREKIIKALKEIGFIYITVDLEGFRSGSMNEVLRNRK